MTIDTDDGFAVVYAVPGEHSDLIINAIAGREAMRELTVFQLMEMRSLIGLVLLWPLVRLLSRYERQAVMIR